MSSSHNEISEQIDQLTQTIKNSAENSEQIASNLKSLILECGKTQNLASNEMMFFLTIFVLACFVGYYVVWKVTPALHTPLMSVTNAISGIIVVGAIIALGPNSALFSSKILGFTAVLIASVNIFGGFVVTHRMLEMFKKKQ